MTWDLVADIGGTNMRVAQVIGGRMAHRHDFAMTPDRDVARTLGEVAGQWGGAPGRIVAAGAGPVRNGQIALTNGGWLVCERQIAAATGAGAVHVINDFEAAAWSLATLADADVRPVGNSKPLTQGHRVAVGPGTGLGVGSLIWNGHAYVVVPGEGGHVGLGPRRPEDIPVFERLARIWPAARLSGTIQLEAEAFLSGTGLPMLYQACGGQVGLSGRDIFTRAREGEGAALQCRAIFADQLAALCGNLAVTFKATGGLFLVGGVAQANADLFDAAFWEAFRQGGRDAFTALRSDCGIYLVTITDFGLRGCVNALSNQG